MKSLSLIISQKVNPSELLQKLKDFDFSNLQISIIILSNEASEASSGQWQHDEKIHFHIIPYPEEEFQLKDLLDSASEELICFLNPTLNYPVDYFQIIIKQSDNEEDDQPVKRKGSLMERILKASQQSKYGLGILKKDIRRDFSELKFSKLYYRVDFKSGNILELSVDEELPKEIFRWAEKNKINSIVYHPDYKKIEYFQDINSYITAVRKEAPFLKFKENKEASGLPLYLLILVWLALISALIFPAGVLLFLIFLAIYALTISLEALAISTIKRQGELFMGLLFFFPFLHHIYLFTYFSGLLVGKKSD